MNHEELLEYRLKAIEAQVTTLALQLQERNEENRRTLRGIFVSIVVGVTMLLITTVVAKVT